MEGDEGRSREIDEGDDGRSRGGRGGSRGLVGDRSEVAGGRLINDTGADLSGRRRRGRRVTLYDLKGVGDLYGGFRERRGGFFDLVGSQ